MRWEEVREHPIKVLSGTERSKSLLLLLVEISRELVLCPCCWRHQETEHFSSETLNFPQCVSPGLWWEGVEMGIKEVTWVIKSGASWTCSALDRHCIQHDLYCAGYMCSHKDDNGTRLNRDSLQYHTAIHLHPGSVTWTSASSFYFISF